MDGGVHQNLAVPRAVPLLGEPALVVTVLAGGRAEVRRGPEVDPPAGEIGADARFQHGLGDVGGVHVHVSDGGHPAGNELGQGQPCAGPDRPAVQLGLRGEDPLVEPGVQVAPPAVAPEQGHGDVGMGVDQAGHEDVVSAVDLPVKGPLGTLGAHGGDGLPLHNHIGPLQQGVRLVHQQGAAVIQ